MSSPSPSRRGAVSSLFVLAFVALAATAACLRDPSPAAPVDPERRPGVRVTPPSASSGVATVIAEPPAPPAGDSEVSAKPTFGTPGAALAVVDRAGTLRLIDANGAVLAIVEGRATDVACGGSVIATFEPATVSTSGAVRIFTISGSTLLEAPVRPVTAETGGLVLVGPSSVDPVFAWAEAEQASLLTITPHDATGLKIGSPASVRSAVLPNGDTSLEVLVTASGSPRIDRLRLGVGGLAPEDDFAVPVAPDVEARMVAAPGARLLVSLEQGLVRLRDEDGGEETGPAVGTEGSTLEDAAARDGRLVLLLGSPPRLVQRDLDNVYTTIDLPGFLPWDPRPSHRLALGSDAIFVVTSAGLLRLPWPPAATTATLVFEPVLADAVAVVVVAADQGPPQQ